MLTRSCKLLLVVNEGTLPLASGGKVRGQTAGYCGGSHADIILLRCRLVNDVSSFPNGCGRTLGLIFKEIFRKNSVLHGKKFTIKPEHLSCTISPIVGITKERTMRIIWEMLSKKVNSILEQFQ